MTERLSRAGTQGLLDADSSLAAGLARARYLVLDEADRLLEPSFEPELRAILSALPAARQTLLFSATMTRSLVALQSASFADAFYFEVLRACQKCCPSCAAGRLAVSSSSGLLDGHIITCVCRRHRNRLTLLYPRTSSHA